MLFTLVATFSYITFYLSAAPFDLSTKQLSYLFAVYLCGLGTTLAGGYSAGSNRAAPRDDRRHCRVHHGRDADAGALFGGYRPGTGGRRLRVSSWPRRAPTVFCAMPLPQAAASRPPACTSVAITLAERWAAFCRVCSGSTAAGPDVWPWSSQSCSLPAPPRCLDGARKRLHRTLSRCTPSRRIILQPASESVSARANSAARRRKFRSLTGRRFRGSIRIA